MSFGGTLIEIRPYIIFLNMLFCKKNKILLGQPTERNPNFLEAQGTYMNSTSPKSSPLSVNVVWL